MSGKMHRVIDVLDSGNGWFVWIFSFVVLGISKGIDYLRVQVAGMEQEMLAIIPSNAEGFHITSTGSLFFSNVNMVDVLQLILLSTGIIGALFQGSRLVYRWFNAKKKPTPVEIVERRPYIPKRSDRWNHKR